MICIVLTISRWTLHNLIRTLGIVILLAGTALAEKRVALVIGNSNYQNVSQLTNPKNDAEAISKSLSRLGFEVITGLDVDRPAFIKKIREFSRAIKGAKVALLFYAGHGLQVGGANYLAPVETQLSDEADLEFETIRLRMIMSQMEREPRINLVFLDACRDNPLARNLARNMGTRSASVGRGLAPIETGIGTLIAFATQPGNVALDGETKNSPFTESLVKHIETPGVDIAVLLRRVRQEVIGKTKGKQVPWSNSSLTGDVVLKAKPKVKAKPVVTVKPKQDSSFELTYWNSIKDGTEPGLFESYLKRYPNGAFADLASIRLKSLSQKREEKPKPKLSDNSAEITFWNSIKGSKDPAILQLYLKQFPGGVYAGLAKYRLSLLNVLQKQKRAIIKQESKQNDNSAEISYWESIKDSSNPGYYQSYLSKYPDGLYAEIAKLKITELKNRENETQLTLLQSPKDDPLKEVDQTPEVTRKTTKNIQKELNRLGCSAGRPDGVWGKGSRKALKQYGRYGKVELVSLEPSNSLLEQLKAKQSRICPLVCLSGYEKKNEKCVRSKREASIQKKEPVKKTTKKNKAKPERIKKPARISSNCPSNALRAGRKMFGGRGKNYYTGTHPCGRKLSCRATGSGATCWWD